MKQRIEVSDTVKAPNEAFSEDNKQISKTLEIAAIISESMANAELLHKEGRTLEAALLLGDALNTIERLSNETTN